MLECIEPKKGYSSDVLVRRKHPEDAAGLLGRVVVGVSAGDLGQGLAHGSIVARSAAAPTNPTGGAPGSSVGAVGWHPGRAMSDGRL